jgi:TatA/E family protein of Tat protein translocase
MGPRLPFRKEISLLALFESPESWLFVAVIGIFLFGASKLPELARSLGRSRAEFQKGLREGAKEEPGEKPAGEEKSDRTRP